MSGSQLIDTLRQLHYPGTESLDPQGLDWMFENEALTPMLDWFCRNVNTTNLLEASDVDEYQAIVEGGDVVLKGRQLDEALNYLECVGDDTVSEESLKQEIEQLSGNVQRYKKQKSRLVKRRNLLGNHQTSLAHRLSKLGVVETKVKHQYKKALEQTHADNTQMNESVGELMGSVDNMSALFTPPTPGGSDVPLPGGGRAGSLSQFLSQMPLQQYYTTEEGYTTQLTAYTKKQFFQGIAEMAGSDEDSRFEILEVSDPDSLLVRGENADVNIRDCKELARLQGLYVKSETDRVRSLCEMRQVKGRLEAAETVLETLKLGTFSTDITKNREQVQKLQNSIVPIKNDYANLAATEIPELIRECKNANVLCVLTGDYNLKLSRQDYFTSNQDKVIKQLIIQRSRNEFLTMSLEIELRRHRELHHLLTAVYTQLQQQLASWQQRMTVMADSSLTPARHQRETVDSRDKSTARLYHMIDEAHAEGREKQLFLTYLSLVENAETLHQKHAGLHGSLVSSDTTMLDSVHAIESSVRRSEGLLYAGSSTTSGQPLMTPRRIQDTMLQLRELLKQLEQGIMDVVKDMDNKKKLLRSNPLLAQERKLFTYFFTNPDKLQRTIDDLATRLQAEKHIDKGAATS